MLKKIKNLISILAVVGLIAGASSVYASSSHLTYSVATPQTTGTAILINGSDAVGSYAHVYDSTGAEVGFGYAGAFIGYTWTPTTAGVYTIAECDNIIASCNVSIPTLTTVEASAGYSGSDTYTITTPVAPPLGLNFFGGTSSGTGSGTMTNTAFIGQVATALGATTTGIYPIVALVGGIILALILIGKIISMYRQAGATTDTKIKAGHTYNSLGKDLGKTPKHTLKMVRQGVWVRD
jgi:hypothetical protein